MRVLCQRGRTAFAALEVPVERVPVLPNRIRPAGTRAAINASEKMVGGAHPTANALSHKNLSAYGPNLNKVSL
jgi:hypothetical protein